MRRVKVGGWALVLCACFVGLASGQELPYEREPIAYLTGPVDDPIARLDARLARGEVTLERDKERGYLPALLGLLGVSPTSQVLVFSKTSFQHTRISPQAPRALYFGDDVYVGMVKGGDYLEVSAVDPKQGAVFYLLDQRDTTAPRFERQTHACLACHSSAKTQGVPGHLVRSVFPDTSGQPVYNAGSFLTDHTSPMNERWGGWYVTGEDGGQEHLGNGVVRDRSHPEQLDNGQGADLADLKGKITTRPYLTPYSDIVALMVLEHQTQAHNRITAASYHARLASHYDAGINKALGRPEDYVSETSRRRIDRAADDLADYLLFADEPRLAAPVAGTSGFADSFSSQGKRDAQGRSLREFDLKTRLFQYPCSYLIDSESFNNLPGPIKQRVYARMVDVLTGKVQGPKFAHLDDETRRATLEILRATHEGFPEGP
jgi:hypothetical protein